MDQEKYIQTQTSLMMLGAIVADMPLGEFLNAINTAESIGPVVDPTLFRAANGNLQMIHDLAEALLPFQRAVLKLRTGGPSAEYRASHGG